MGNREKLLSELENISNHSRQTLKFLTVTGGSMLFFCSSRPKLASSGEGESEMLQYEFGLRTVLNSQALSLAGTN